MPKQVGSEPCPRAGRRFILSTRYTHLCTGENGSETTTKGWGWDMLLALLLLGAGLLILTGHMIVR